MPCERSVNPSLQLAMYCGSQCKYLAGLRGCKAFFGTERTLLLLRKSALDLGSCSQIRKRPFCSYFYSAKSVRAGFLAVSTDAGIKGTVTYNNGDGDETVSLKVTSVRLSQLSHPCLMWANSPEAEFQGKNIKAQKEKEKFVVVCLRSR